MTISDGKTLLLSTDGEGGKIDGPSWDAFLDSAGTICVYNSYDQTLIGNEQEGQGIIVTTVVE